MSFALQGKKIYLRPFEPEDVEALHEYLNDPNLAGRRYLPHGFSDDFLLSRKQTGEIIEQWGRADYQVHLAIILSETQKLIGHASAYWGWDPHYPGVDLVISSPY